MPLDTSKFLFEALTYDDVLLVPAYSEVLPRETDTSSKLTSNIKLNIPLVSAAMDTVTEAELAISIAMEGGLGFIHKNMKIGLQAEQLVFHLKVRQERAVVGNAGIQNFDVATASLHEQILQLLSEDPLRSYFAGKCERVP